MNRKKGRRRESHCNKVPIMGEPYPGSVHYSVTLRMKPPAALWAASSYAGVGGGEDREVSSRAFIVERLSLF